MPTDTAIPETHSTPPPADTGPSAAPSTGAKPSSFRPPNPEFDALTKRLSSRWAKSPPPETKPTPPKPEEVKPEAKPPESQPKPEDVKPPETPQEKEAPKEESAKEGETSESAGKEKKLSPWRLVDQWKKTSEEWKTKAETASQELERIKAGKPAELPKEVTEEIQGLKSRVQDYEKRIQLLDYQNSDEFVTKHLKPYNDEFSRTMQRLQGIPVTQQDGTSRAIEPNDIFKLLVLPAGEAEVKAREIFGDFAGTVIRRVEKLQDLFDAQQTALKDAKENGATRLKAQREAMETQQKEHQTFVTETWEKENRLALTDDKYGKYFSPIEGDQKGNAALAQGLKTVQEAFSANPHDPNLTKEEQGKIIRRHAKIFNAAAAFPRMCQWLEERDAKIAALEKENEEYKKSEPPTTGGTKPSEPQKSSDFFSSFGENLRKRTQR